MTGRIGINPVPLVFYISGRVESLQVWNVAIYNRRKCWTTPSSYL